MGFIDRILGRSPKAVEVIKAAETLKFVSGYEPVFRDWRGEIYESLLVRAAIDARARHASKLKINIKGTAKPDLSAKLKRRPNPWHTWSQELYRISTILDCCNNCIIVPIYDNNKDLNKIGIYAALPTQCTIVTYKDELWLKYKFMNGRQTAACRLNECAILTRYQFKNDFFGSDQSCLDETLDLMSITKQGIKEAVKSTAGYKFMAKLSNFSKASDLQAERESFSEAAFGKEAKKSGVLLFPNTYNDIKQIDIKPFTPDKDQMELINNNVYSYFGVNEDILMNKAAGDAWSAFYEGAIEPFAIQLSETLTSALFSDREVSIGSLVVFTANRIAYMTFADKLAYVEGLGDRGMLFIDEGREVFDLPPLPDGQGQKLMARGEYYDVLRQEDES